MKLEFAPNQEIKVYKIPNSEDIFKANILVNVKGNIIITRPHIFRGKSLFYMDSLEPNSLIYGDYEYNGKKFYFRTVVIKSSFSPFPHVIIKEPEGKNIKVKNIRKFERYSAILPLNIIFKKKDQEIKINEAFCLDISIKGIGIITPIELSEQFLAGMVLFNKEVTLDCVIRKFIENFYNNFHFCGCEIMNIENRDEFARYIQYLKMISEYKHE